MEVARKILPFLLLIILPSLGRSQSSSLRNDPVYQAARKAQQEGRIADAEKILNDRIHSIEETQPNSPDLVPYLNMLAGFYSSKRQFPEALAIFERVLAIDQAAFGPSTDNSLRDLINVAGFLGPDKKDQAEQLFKQAVELTRQNPKLLPITVAGAYAALARFYEVEKRWSDAEPVAEQGMKICAYVTVPPDSGPCGPLQKTLSAIYLHEGRTVEAETMTDSIPSGIDADLPPELVALHKSAQRSEKDGLYPDAEFSYRQAATYVETHPKYDGGKMPVDLRGMVSDEYNNIGHILELEGRNDLAEEFYKKAITSREAFAAELQIPLRSFNFSQLTALYRKEGRLSEMEPIFQHALDLQEKGIGESGINVARTLVLFGNLYKDEAKYAEAEALYDRAMKIYEANLGLLDRQEASALQPYADLLHKLHEDAKAAEIQGWVNMIENK